MLKILTLVGQLLDRGTIAEIGKNTMKRCQRNG